MISFKQFLEEAHGYSELQEFVIRAWGKLLYLDYESLPSGKNQSDNLELKKLIREYNSADEDQIEDLDEFIGEGAPMKNGTNLLSRQTVDHILHSAEHSAGNIRILYRFDHSTSNLRPNSWISLSTKDQGYDGARSE